jgi:uncharacterized protein YkwD
MNSRNASTYSWITNRRSLAIAVTLVLNGCGGGGSSLPASTGSSVTATVAAAQSSTVDFQAQTADLNPKSAGISACVDPQDSSEFSSTTGFSYNATSQTQVLESLLNHARCLAGVPALARHQALDVAASNHANYSVLNASATHTESSALAGFTASNPGERMSASGYSSFSAQRAEPYQWGEVLARTGPVAREAHEGLMSAIYHRLAMLSPQVAHAGLALHTTADTKEMVSVIDMAASTDLRMGGLIAYPAAGQLHVPVAFNSDLELPDPFPAQGFVGYPISVQSDRGSVLQVSKFELRDSQQQIVPAYLRAKTANPTSGVQADTQLDSSEAFLSAAAALTPSTLYTVRFEGTLDGVPVVKTWSFSTEASKALATAENNALTINAFTRVRIEGCSGAYSWRFTNGLQVSMFSTSWMQVRALSKGMQWIEVSDTCGNKQRIDFQVS